MADAPCWRAEHYFIKESDGARVCQICGEVKAVSKHKQAQVKKASDEEAEPVIVEAVETLMRLSRMLDA